MDESLFKIRVSDCLIMNKVDAAGVTEKRDAAYEIKFVVPMPVAEAVITWARRHLSPDPHVAPAEVDGYRVNSLYFDTEKLDVFQRNGSYGKAKYRVRRYGSETSLFLERKLKSRGLVSKRRTRIPNEDVSRLDTVEPDADWVGYWFSRRLLARQLLPQCQIRYDRVARVGMTEQGPVRLTLDRNVHSFPTNTYQVSETGEWKPLLEGQAILELKFRLEMPELFRNLLQELSLASQPMSKYRLSVNSRTPPPTVVPLSLDGHGSTGNGHSTAADLSLFVEKQGLTAGLANPKQDA